MPAEPGSPLGAPLTRVEDERLVRGSGNYVGDLRIPGMLDVAFVRSPVPHARVAAIGTSLAAKAPGVVAVITAGDLADVAPVPDFLEPMVRAVQAFPLAREVVRYVGEPVAAVVAADRYLAEDAADLVTVHYEPLPVVADTGQATRDDAPRLYPGWPDNYLCNEMSGDPDEAARDFAGLRSIGATFTVQRQAPMPIENRGVVAEWRHGRLTVWSSTQFPHLLRGMLARVLCMPERAIRAVAPDVGGGFGGKAEVYAEEYLVAWAARRLDRPVRWLEDRHEHLIAACHARDVRIALEGAFRDDGVLVSVRGSVIQDAGTGAVYPNGVAPAFVTGAATVGCYKIRSCAVRVSSVVTNKTPTGAYRGFGCPEGTFAIERLLDLAAAELGLDRVEIRRRNILRPQDLPYVQATGARIDSGSHLQALDEAAELAERAAAEERAAVAGSASIAVGYGVVAYLQGVVPTYFTATGAWTSQDSASISFDPDGGVSIGVGIAACGQGAATAVATLGAHALGVRRDQVRVVMGDTDTAPYGLGAWGSRGAAVAAGSIVRAAAEVRAKGVRIAAHLLEVAPADIEVGDGAFYVRGDPDSSVGWDRVATAALIRTLELPPDIEPGLEGKATYDPPGLDHLPDGNGKMNAAATYSNAAHAAVVRVDLATGQVRLVRYLIVNDCGKMINPLLVAGQVHGGVVQGIGAALQEELAYANGVPRSTDLFAYALPTAADVPDLELRTIETPAPGMAMGVKGVGESGIVGPPPVLAQAVDDALRSAGIELGTSGTMRATPITPTRVLAAIAGTGGTQ